MKRARKHDNRRQLYLLSVCHGAAKTILGDINERCPAYPVSLWLEEYTAEAVQNFEETGNPKKNMRWLKEVNHIWKKILTSKGYEDNVAVLASFGLQLSEKLCEVPELVETVKPIAEGFATVEELIDLSEEDEEKLSLCTTVLDRLYYLIDWR